MNRDPLLIRFPNWLGDVVMSLSALEAIHRSGKFEITALIREPWNTLLAHDPRIRETIVCRDRGPAILRTVAEIRARKFSAVVDFTHSFRSRLLWTLAGIPRIFRELPSSCSSHTVEPRTLNVEPPDHQISRYISVLQDLIGDVTDVPDPIITPPPVLPESSGREIFLFPGAAFGPAKTWSVEKYRELIQMLLEQGHPVRVLGTTADRGLIESISSPFVGRTAEYGNSDITVSIGLALADLIGHIRTARAVISCDSGAAHLAAALDRVVLVMFFSTDPARTAPRGRFVQCVPAHIVCEPCFKRTCPINYLCRDALTPLEVAHQLEDMLGVQGSRFKVQG